MKSHLNRIATPRTWNIDRKARYFIYRPKSSGHPALHGMALGTLFKEYLHLAETAQEVKKLLQQSPVLVDGRSRKDPRFQVGLFDILVLPALQKAFEINFDVKGRLQIQEIPLEKSKHKWVKVVGKTTHKSGKAQLHFHDGKNLLDGEAQIGDTLKLSLPELKITQRLPLQEGVSVFLIGGAHRGDSGTVQQLQREGATYQRKGRTVETAKKYLLVLPQEHPLIQR